MQGYVARKGDRYYAVIYEGLDPATGRERRRWHPAGTDRAEAQRLATRLAAKRAGDGERHSGLTLGVYLTQQWIPAKQINLQPSTWDAYRRNIELHVVPHLGRMPLRRLRAEHLETLYTRLLVEGRVDGDGGLAAKTVLEIHGILRKALGDATRRGLVVRNVAADAHAPKRRSSETTELRAWNAQQLRAFLDVAQTHRLFAAFWLAANTGMRRSELLGLRWNDLDLNATRLSVNRALISVAYELHESAGKTRNSRRMVDLDPKTVAILRDWQEGQRSEHGKLGIERENGYVFTKPDGSPVHPDVFRQTFDRLVARAGVPRIRLHDLRHTHATLLLKERIPTKVVSERLGHATPAFTMATYQHVMPGMQAEAARVFAGLLEPSTGFHPVEDR